MKERYLTTCSDCEAQLRVDSSVLGSAITCPRCAKSFHVGSLRPLADKPTIRAGDSMATSELETVRAINEETLSVEGGQLTAGQVNPQAEPAESGTTKTAARTVGRYELRRILGRGAFGEVWFAFDTHLRRDVAIKLPLFPSSDQKRVRRFLSEAKAAAGLRHPNIVAVYDFGNLDGQLYLATEYAEGEPLSTYREGKALPQDLAAEIVLKLAEALAFAHEANVIHRDLKPHNVVIDSQGEPQLLDFGLAKRLDDNASHTIDGSVLGTPAYMSPEQARGDIKQIGPHSDQYSLGVILYRLLSGRTPFEGPPTVVLQQVIGFVPPALTKFVSDIDPRLVAICNKSRLKTPQDRYANCQELANDLRRFLNDESVAARPDSRVQACVKWVKRNRREATLAAIAATVMILAFIVSAYTLATAASKSIAAIKLEMSAREETSKRLMLEADLQTKLKESQAARDAAIKARDEANLARSAADKETAAIEAATALALEAEAKAKAAIDSLAMESESFRSVSEDIRKIQEKLEVDVKLAANSANANAAKLPQIAVAPIHNTFAGIPGPGEAYVSSVLDLLRSHPNFTFRTNTTGRLGGIIFGTGSYAIYSPISTAAVHAGVLKNGQQGDIAITTLSPTSTNGSLQNDVQSSDFGQNLEAFRLEPESAHPHAIRLYHPSEVSITSNQFAPGDEFMMLVAGSPYGGPVWGDGVYTSDSNLANAALHSGVVGVNQVALVRVTIDQGQYRYRGSTANGVTTSSYGSYPKSFRLSKIIVPAANNLNLAANPVNPNAIRQPRIHPIFSVAIPATRRQVIRSINQFSSNPVLRGMPAPGNGPDNSDHGLTGYITDFSQTQVFQAQIKVTTNDASSLRFDVFEQNAFRQWLALSKQRMTSRTGAPPQTPSALAVVSLDNQGTTSLGANITFPLHPISGNRGTKYALADKLKPLEQWNEVCLVWSNASIAVFINSYYIDDITLKDRDISNAVVCITAEGGKMVQSQFGFPMPVPSYFTTDYTVSLVK
jgi:hypothetical protein